MVSVYWLQIARTYVVPKLCIRIRDWHAKFLIRMSAAYAGNYTRDRALLISTSAAVDYCASTLNTNFKTRRIWIRQPRLKLIHETEFPQILLAFQIRRLLCIFNTRGLQMNIEMTCVIKKNSPILLVVFVVRFFWTERLYLAASIYDSLLFVAHILFSEIMKTWWFRCIWEIRNCLLHKQKHLVNVCDKRVNELYALPVETESFVMWVKSWVKLQFALFESHIFLDKKRSRTPLIRVKRFTFRFLLSGIYYNNLYFAIALLNQQKFVIALSISHWTNLPSNK